MSIARWFVDRAGPHTSGHGDHATTSHGAADARLVSYLAEQNFTGPDYQRFENDLAAYALSVLTGWLRTGFIFHVASKYGYGLSPSAADLEDLARSSDSRSDLAIMIIASALPRFRRRALISGEWDPTRGASLTSYFLGACLQTFPNKLRRWQGERRRWTQAEAAAARVATASDVDEAAMADPASHVLSKSSVQDLLVGMDPRTRAIVTLVADGYTQDEIVEMLGETSVRSVEGVLYRWRQRMRRGQRRGGARHG